MNQKHALMRARQSGAQALNSSSYVRDELIKQAEDSFERWEIAITENELALDCHEMPDSLEYEYAKLESEEALREELAALMAKE
jgi:phage shock protein A